MSHSADTAAARSAGFGEGGVTRGSAAADMQRTGADNTPKVVSALQSLGASGKMSNSAQSNLAHTGPSTGPAVNAAGFQTGGIDHGSAGAGMMATGADMSLFSNC